MITSIILVSVYGFFVFFFFKQKTAYEMRISDWSSDVCSSDLQFQKPSITVTGMGKSGHIATKIAATLASTGTPAFFVHPGEASHGDLGMITRQDEIGRASGRERVCQ